MMSLEICQVRFFENRAYIIAVGHLQYEEEVGRKCSVPAALVSYANSKLLGPT